MDPWRPRWHFAPPTGWMNDPNGPIQLRGLHHLFYQHNPGGATWGDIHWGHAVSPDLLRWSHRPLALAPSRERGEDHCFSGSCVLDPSGRPRIFYTSVGRDCRDAATGPELWAAWGSPDLDTWTKDPRNPLMTLESQGQPGLRDWRDPYVWFEDGVWHMLQGCSLEGRGAVLHYLSKDLDRWEGTGPLCPPEGEVVWECPNLRPLGDGSHLLIWSPDGAADNRVRWRRGFFDGRHFEPFAEGILDGGGKANYYAALLFTDEAGRLLVHGWAGEGDRAVWDRAAGARPAWNGALALPRLVEPAVGGGLRLSPLPEAESLRQPEPETLPPGPLTQTLRPQTRGLSLEIDLTLRWTGRPGVLDLAFALSPEGHETRICLDPVQLRAVLHREASGAPPGIETRPLLLDLPRLDPATDLRLRVFLDHSLVEIFAGLPAPGPQSALSARIYPAEPEALGLALRPAQPGTWNLVSGQIWSLAL